MDGGDGSGFSFPTTSDYSSTRAQDPTDLSWGDIFLDAIHSDEAGAAEAGAMGADASNLGLSIHGHTQQFVHHAQSNVLGGQLQIRIPTHLQGSLTSNAIQQAGANLCGTVAYITPSVSTQQQVGAGGRIQNMVTVAGQSASAVGQQQQQQQHQGNAKLVQIASSFPMAQVQQLAGGMPIQTILQQNQTLTGQTIYGSQGGGLFPTQGSVHIENPKVVNVNFGPHVIGSDGSGQQAIIQTAEGKRVFITNSQLQHLPQLINSAGGNVIRTNLPTGTHTIMSASGGGTQQIVLPSGQTMIPRQTHTGQAGLTKNVLLRPLGQNISPVIYQGGQTGSLIQSQPTLIASNGTALQVVNTTGNQGGQVQLIAQPSINQSGLSQQQLNQNAIMNLLNNQNVLPGGGNQISGLMSGQNIFVNGQMLNIAQLGSLTVPQLQVQQQQGNSGGVTLANINAAVSRASTFQPSTQQLVFQHGGQQQHLLLQSKNTQQLPVSTSISQRLNSGMQSSSHFSTLSSSPASSRTVLTPTPSTPTPTPTPDLISDSCDSGGKNGPGINILEQALAMSAIDLQSLEDEFNFLDGPDCCSSTMTVSPPPTIRSQTPLKTKPPAKPKSKASKAKSKTVQPTVNVTINSSTMQMHPSNVQLLNSQGQKVTIAPQQKIITANGQVFILSANGQQFILQPSNNSANSSELKPVHTVVSSSSNIVHNNTNYVTSDSQLKLKGLNQVVQNQSSFNNASSIKNPEVFPQQKVFTVRVQEENTVKPEGLGVIKVEPSVQSVPTSQVLFTSTPSVSTYTPTSVHYSQSQVPISTREVQPVLQVKSQKITTLKGTFLKQEPVVVKQEPGSDLSQSVTHLTSPNLPTSSSLSNLSTSSFLTVTTSSLVSTSAPLVTSSAPLTALTTVTTQSHQVTIMSTSQATNSQQTTVVSSGSSPFLQTSPFTDKSEVTSDTVFLSPNTSPQLHHTPSSTTSSSSSKSSSKEKDPANIKTMMSIKIADSTLMLSLTPGQKERLEDQLSRMSKEDQECFLTHQQNIIRRTQQVQQKQLEQQMKQQQQKKLLQHQQSASSSETHSGHLQFEPTFQSQQSPSRQPRPPSLSQHQQSQLLQQHSPSLKLNQSPHVMHDSEQLQQGPPVISFPTTVQELMDKPEDSDTQQNLLSYCSKPPEEQALLQQQQQHTQQKHQTSPQQQIYSNLPPTQSQHQQQTSNLFQAQPQQQQVYPSLSQSQCQQPQQTYPNFSQAQSQQQPQVYPAFSQAQSQQPQTFPSAAQRSALDSGSGVGPTQQYMLPQSGRCLAEQQLLRDRSLAVSPDTKTPFRNLSDAMRRLVRYHTLQDHKPEEDHKAVQTWDTKYSKVCAFLMKKKRRFLRRYSKMQLYHEMCSHKRPEYVQNLMCFNDQLQSLLDYEKDRAKNSPDTFEPIDPEKLCKKSNDSDVSESPNSNSDVVKCESLAAEDDRICPTIKEEYFDVKDLKPVLPEIPPELPASLVLSPPSHKRKIPTGGSTTTSSGTLKLILKRGTTDNFVVSKSLSHVGEFPENLPPVGSDEKSDSEYELDSNTAEGSGGRPVILRRRTLSSASRQTSSSYNSSEREQDQSSVDSDIGEGNDMPPDGEEDEAEDEAVLTSNDEDDAVEDKQRLIKKFKASSNNEGEDDGDSDDSCSASTDAFMETDAIVVEPKSIRHEKVTHKAAHETDLRGSGGYSPKKHRQSASGRSVKSKGVLNTTLSVTNTLFNPPSDYGDPPTFIGANSNGGESACVPLPHDSKTSASTLFDQKYGVSLTKQKEEPSPTVSVRNIKKEMIRKGLSNSSSLLTQSGKSFLDTDAMFISDEENDRKEDDQMESSFDIDNKDPQSSMMNDSVRSAIRSVLDGGDDDSEDDKGTSCYSSWPSIGQTSAGSGSSFPNNMFRSSSTLRAREVDLDAAVQSILNK